MTLTNRYGVEKMVSIVIPTMNVGPNIKHVFSNIPKYVDEIVVVDANSTDGTRDEIKKYREDAKIAKEYIKDFGETK